MPHFFAIFFKSGLYLQYCGTGKTLLSDLVDFQKRYLIFGICLLPLALYPHFTVKGLPDVFVCQIEGVNVWQTGEATENEYIAGVFLPFFVGTEIDIGGKIVAGTEVSIKVGYNFFVDFFQRNVRQVVPSADKIGKAVAYQTIIIILAFTNIYANYQFALHVVPVKQLQNSVLLILNAHKNVFFRSAVT
jgi:hypothetical protein